jgi:hypothetical protein
MFYLFPTEIKKIMFPFIDALHFFPVPNNISQKAKKKNHKYNPHQKKIHQSHANLLTKAQNESLPAL